LLPFDLFTVRDSDHWNFSRKTNYSFLEYGKIIQKGVIDIADR
jgi:hypothetical protein